MIKEVRVLVVGNPNCGKTVVFNALTGLQQKVGNWSGVTVERKQGSFVHQNARVDITDLPGIYSMTLASEQEALDAKVACKHLLNTRYDLIVNVLDAANLERNLYLSSQLVSLNIPMVLAVNMMDVAKRKGIKVNTKQLSKLWHCPVVPMVACKGEGIEELKDTIITLYNAPHVPKFSIPFVETVQTTITNIKSYLKDLIQPSQIDSVA